MSTFSENLEFFDIGIQSTALILQSKLRFYDEESWTDLQNGIPYLSLKIGKIKQAINTQILDTANVLDIKHLEVTENKEKILVDLEVATIFGDINVNKK